VAYAICSLNHLTLRALTFHAVMVASDLVV